MTSHAAKRRAHKASRRLVPIAPRRAKAETTDTPKPKPQPQDRDGLDWLIRKKRLRPDQIQTAQAYRAAFRDAGGVSLRSCLDDTPGGGSGSGGLACAMAHAVDGPAWLQHVRWTILAGQGDMITVMDGVCGAGATLISIARGNDRRAGELEAVLKVALDLVGAMGRKVAA